MRVAVVGAGLFGIAAALALRETGAVVELFERHLDLMAGASGINHGRLHRGYHYPRSPETAKACENSFPQFAEYFSACIRDKQSFVGIASSGSRINSNQYESAIASYGLPLTRVSTGDLFDSSRVSSAYSVSEKTIDLYKLRALCWDLLQKREIRVSTGLRFRSEMARHFDACVIASYAGLPELVAPQQLPRLRYDTVEKILLDPKTVQGADASRLVLDGPFVNVSPFSREGVEYVMVGDALTDTIVRTVALGPAYLKRGHVRPDRIRAASYMPDLANATITGKVTTVRVTLDGVSRSDRRPSLVRQVGERTWAIVGGKLVTCISVGRMVADTIGQAVS